MPKLNLLASPAEAAVFFFISHLCSSSCWRAACKRWWAPSLRPGTRSSPPASPCPPGLWGRCVGKASSPPQRNLWRASESVEGAEDHSGWIKRSLTLDQTKGTEGRTSEPPSYEGKHEKFGQEWELYVGEKWKNYSNNLTHEIQREKTQNGGCFYS